MRGKFKIKLVTEKSAEVLFEGNGDERQGLVEASKAYLQHARIHATRWPQWLARDLKVREAKPDRLIRQTFELKTNGSDGEVYVSIERLYL